MWKILEFQPKINIVSHSRSPQNLIESVEDLENPTTINRLMAHNWQKWKSVFLTCSCHKTYRDEAVGLKSCKYTWKIKIFVKCEIWGNIVKIWYFVNNCLIEARIKNSFAHVWHIYFWLSEAQHILFQLNRFSVKYRFPFPILRFLL